MSPHTPASTIPTEGEKSWLLAPVSNGVNEDYRLVLPQSRVPTHWYNIQADLPVAPAPVLHPGTHQPVGPADLSVLFPMECILQEVSQEKYIPIPDEVRDIYRLWRPTPLVRAVRLEKALDTPAHIYYKSEVGSPSGSHKLNTSLAQAYYNKKEGIDSIATETGAGQWGSALWPSQATCSRSRSTSSWSRSATITSRTAARSCRPMARASPPARPSGRTPAAAILARNPNSTGSLGIAISEAVEVAATSGGKTKYSLGSVLNHVLLHQTVIGQEALDAMEEIGEYPDVVIGCVGGGSNFAGLAFPFIERNLTQGKQTRFVAAEPASCPSLTKGAYTYDFGDSVGMTPLVKMHTLGHDFEPARDPCRRPPLSRHGAARLAAGQTAATSPRGPTSRIPASRRASCSPAPKRPSPRPRARTPSGPRSTRRWTPRPRARSA